MIYEAWSYMLLMLLMWLELSLISDVLYNYLFVSVISFIYRV